MKEPFRKVNLFVDKKWIVPDWRPVSLLVPFLGQKLEDRDLSVNRSNKYGFNRDHFELVKTVGEADFVLMPYDYWKFKKNYPLLFKEVVEISRASVKPLLIDASGDRFGRINIENSLVLRTNQYRFNLPPNEITIPFPCEDLLESFCGGQLQLRKKTSKPSVGFAGWARTSFLQKLKTIIKESPYLFLGLFKSPYRYYLKGVLIRERVISIFLRSNKILQNFIVRSSYSGNLDTLDGDPLENRREFVLNMLNSDYSLAIKGDANASARFYEILSLGRIPIFVDTGCVLPLEEDIDYKEFCFFVDYLDIKHAPDAVTRFHHDLTSEEFEKKQKLARYYFENYLRYDAFSLRLAQKLLKFLATRKT